ncbi:MAG: Gfo/Idh/MocA family oxidoreductase [Eubacterium sp.]|nr:Gfo/Idh/MocA family oxidoreductase [Eubacterium sp.]
MKLGIIGCSEIAFRRFMPVAKEIESLEVVAVAEEYDKSKLAPFCETYELEGVESFDALIQRADLDALYIPQPPALHFPWAKKALENGKHVLLEKPSTTRLEDSESLVSIAREKGLALHENYMFQYHSQIGKIKELLEEGVIGELRNIRCNFGFPMRAQNDFRYNKELGGGALLDAGGYTAKLATLFLGKTIQVDAATLNYMEGYEVDMYGSVQFSNEDGMVCQTSFGMDNGYQCNLDVWGSKGRLCTNRIFTAPENFNPVVVIETAEGKREITLEPDQHFKKSIEQFMREVQNQKMREAMYDEIVLQAKLIEKIKQDNTP